MWPMMSDDRRRKLVGISLITVGALFLMVSNGILLGWEHVWPLFPIAAGIMFLRNYARRPAPWLVFTGLTTALCGLFFFCFSTGIFSWPQLATMWPMFPLIVGLSFVGEALVNRDNSPLVIIGSTIILFSAVAFLLESGSVTSRVAAPFIRFWPLALVLAGVVLLKTSPKKKPDPDMEVVREVLAQTEAAEPPEGDIPPGLQAAILDQVRAAPDPDSAVAALVQGLKANFSKYWWVGVYRLTADMLTIGNRDFAGVTPEYRDIHMDEGICGAAATEKRTIVVPDVGADDRYLTCNLAVKSEIVVPILADDQIVGVLDVDSNELDAFTGEDRRFLEGLAERAAPYLRVGLPSA
jgi:GAF domain-containing protein